MNSNFNARNEQIVQWKSPLEIIVGLLSFFLGVLFCAWMMQDIIMQRECIYGGNCKRKLFGFITTRKNPVKPWDGFWPNGFVPCTDECDTSLTWIGIKYIWNYIVWVVKWTGKYFMIDISPRHK